MQSVIKKVIMTAKEKEKSKEITKCQYCGLENENHKLSCPTTKTTILL